MSELDLIVYPWVGWGYQLPNEFVPADDADEESQRKRFSDAELAAEYLRAAWIAESERSTRADEVARICYRFATHPHYDEAS